MRVLVAVFIQPGQCLAMLVAEPCGDPYDGRRAGSGSIRQQLAEMTVVRVAQLVLHDQHDVVCLVLAEDVQRVTADCILGGLELQLYPQSLGEPISVLRQPRREVQSFMRPDRPRIDRLKPTELLNLSTKYLCHARHVAACGPAYATGRWVAARRHHHGNIIRALHRCRSAMRGPSGRFCRTPNDLENRVRRAAGRHGPLFYWNVTHSGRSGRSGTSVAV